MDPKELIELGGALAVVVTILLLLRRAAARSRARGPVTARERLAGEKVVEKPQRVRKTPKKRYGKGPAEEPEPEEEETEEPEVEEPEQPEEPEEAPDAEAAAAYKAGLAKTRGGFVAKLGKLYGKKKIDEETLGELEEALFTADIGPRAADRIFQAVKGGLSKAELESADKIWTQIRKTSKEILSV